jgi:hypothetical protein
MVRGSKTKWSNHAYAAAIDLNAGENALGKKGNMPQFIVDAFCRQGAMWGGWYVKRPDWMHFEFVDNGGHKPKGAAPHFAAVAHMFEADNEAPADEFEDAAADDTDAHEAEPALPPSRRDPVPPVTKKDDPEIIGKPPEEKKPEGDGFVATTIKLVKSKIAWASTGLGSLSMASVGGFLGDWRTVTAIGVIVLVGLILYWRSQKP